MAGNGGVGGEPPEAGPRSSKWCESRSIYDVECKSRTPPPSDLPSLSSWVTEKATESLAAGELVRSKLPSGVGVGGFGGCIRSRSCQSQQGSQRKEKGANSGDEAQEDGTGCDVRR